MKTTVPQDIKDFYDFASYHISEGNIDFEYGTLEAIKSLVIWYVDECKNNNYELPVSFHDEIDYWHVANILQSQFTLEIDYYKTRLSKAREAIKILKDI